MASVFTSSVLSVPNQRPVPKTIPSQGESSALRAVEGTRQTVNSALAKDVQDTQADLYSVLSNAPAEYTTLRNESWLPYFVKHEIRPPPDIDAGFQDGVSYRMGLLPQMNLAWWASGSRVVLWDYLLPAPNNLTVLADMEYPVTSVALVKPRRNVYQATVSWVLLVVTSARIIFHALHQSTLPSNLTSGAQSQPWEIYDSDLSVDTTSYGEMTSVCGTDDGRIFMCGARDGCVYELVYRRTESWGVIPFVTRGARYELLNRSVPMGTSLYPAFLLGGPKHDLVRLLAVDPKRNVLYALTNQEDISVYYLGTPTPANQEASLHFSAPFTAKNIYTTALTQSPSNPGLPNKQSFHIASLVPTLPQESKYIHLIAVTTAGLRLYFTFFRRNLYVISSPPYPTPNGAPAALDLMFIRSPPAIPYDAVVPRTDPTWYGRQRPTQPQQPQGYTFSFNQVNSATLCSSDFLIGQALPKTGASAFSKAVVLACSPDLGRLFRYNADPNPMSGGSGLYSTLSPAQRPPLTESWTVLPLDGLTHGIAPLSTPAFILYAPDSASVTSEMLSMFTAPAQQYVVLTTAAAYVLQHRRPVDVLRALVERSSRSGSEDDVQQFHDVFGKDQSCAMALALACGNTLTLRDWTPPNVPTNAGQVSTLSRYSMSFEPQMQGQGVELLAGRLFQRWGGHPIRLRMGTTQDEGTMLFSGKYQGLTIYVSRLMRPLWKEKVAAVVAGKFQTNVTMSTLSQVQTELTNLNLFMDREMGLFEIFTSDGPADDVARERELAACRSLKALVSRTIEAIAFVMLMIDFGLHDVMLQCDQRVRDLLPKMSYEELLVTEQGTEAARALVNAIINHQISQQRSVDAVSDVLHKKCGSFCSPEQVVVYKGYESIRLARQELTAQRITHLQESLRLFSQAARALTPEKLTEYCKEYCDLGFPQGAIGLPLVCAREWDAFSEGAAYFAAGKPQNDPRSYRYAQREAAYKCALDSLKMFDDRVQQAADPAVADADRLRNAAYALALQSEDEIFHYSLYQWFVDNGQETRLLELHTPFIEIFLTQPPPLLWKHELLWQFYVRNNRSTEAAYILNEMAYSTDDSLTLEQRISYLSRAVSNAKSLSAPAPVGDQSPVEFLTDLEERLEVAQLQAETYSRLQQQLGRDTASLDALKKLGSQLWTITDLWQQFAMPYDMDFIKLLILHVSNHSDLNLVMGTWRRIFETAKETAASQGRAAHDYIADSVVRYGQRLYPSNVAFPLDLLLDELLRYQYENKDTASIPSAWACKMFVDVQVDWRTLFDLLEAIYADHSSPPWSTPEGQEFLRLEIAEYLSLWFIKESSPGALQSSTEFPVSFVDQKVGEYMNVQTSELGRKILLELSKALRRIY
ncbi:nucleoporin-domain-containing protein [Dacryopinax primogenitus]|uniref:Nucleoporin-domain-containing protein n=1 Tax=Dacryopinax primogenitus (strain DJM 731) TaxID=1858805 RepID=M5FTU4_DACPD|nr:nucleoporin-domain-containing protein [Dacryopinax primogenitus]EJU01086.1 nucleoporin-domain-containing protein [Dacryopinax primogenitus]